MTDDGLIIVYEQGIGRNPCCVLEIIDPTFLFTIYTWDNLRSTRKKHDRFDNNLLTLYKLLNTRKNIILNTFYVSIFLIRLLSDFS